MCVDCFCMLNIISYLCNQNSFCEFYYSNHTRFDFESLTVVWSSENGLRGGLRKANVKLENELLEWKKEERKRISVLVRSCLGDVTMFNTILFRLLVFFSSVCSSWREQKKSSNFVSRRVIVEVILFIFSFADFAFIHEFIRLSLLFGDMCHRQKVNVSIGNINSNLITRIIDKRCCCCFEFGWPCRRRSLATCRRSSFCDVTTSALIYASGPPTRLKSSWERPSAINRSD